MDLEQRKLFRRAEKPLLFTAIACLWGSFHPNERQVKLSSVEGVLTTLDERNFPARIKKKDWEYLLTRENFDRNKKNHWRGYCLTNKSGMISQIDLIQPIQNIVFPVLLDERGELVSEGVDVVKIRGKIQKIESSQFGVRIERNDPPAKRRPGSQKFKGFYLTIQGELPDVATPEQFWELICLREGDYLRLKEGILITEEKVKNWKKDVGEKVDSQKSNQKKIKPSNQSFNSEKKTVTESPIIMLNGKQPEMTVKFTERPELPEQGKKVTLQVTGENGIVVKAEVNRKTLAKQVQKMDSFAEWVAAFSGRVSEITTDGVVILEAANVQVFQRKQKVKEEEKESNNDN